MKGAWIKYGHAWKCRECGERIVLMYCDNFEPIACLKCGGEVCVLSKVEIEKLDEEMEQYITGLK